MATPMEVMSQYAITALKSLLVSQKAMQTGFSRNGKGRSTEDTNRSYICRAMTTP